jgi:uncharacterized protein YabE (DUF348 family)
MKYFRGLALAFLLAACQPRSAPIIIVDGEQTYAVESAERTPLILLMQFGVAPQPHDRVLLNGLVVPIERHLPQTDFIQLQLRRAVTLTLNAPQGRQTFQTSALTVGQALSEAGLTLTKNDFLDPPAETPITQPLTVTFAPARDLTIFVGENTLTVRSAARTVGEALAESGLPLVGLDASVPRGNEAPPPEGQIRVTRIAETVSVSLEPIPFTTQRTEDANLPLGQENTIQPGVNGLAMIRARVRYEDGKEASRAIESKTILREPQTRIVAGGSKITTASLNGVDYWLATEMYATVYSPCASGTGKCSYGTASGARAGKGIVAVDYSIYSYLAGMQVYIPGYGVATIGDTGGGPIIETALGVARTKWIDLGFNDGEIVDMTGWVKVYFLAPAPAESPYFLK